MFVHALMQVPLCKANITCIAQVTFKLVNEGLLFYKQRFGKHSLTLKDLTTNFTILKKCNSKFDCLIYEMFFINELRPSLNAQRDSICAKVFKSFLYVLIVFNTPLFNIFMLLHLSLLCFTI